MPIHPAHWEYHVSSCTKKQFDVLKKLLRHSQVDTVINATDTGREGELIFRLVYEKAGCNKPVKRLWISSLEDTSIQKGYEHLKYSKEYYNLSQVALCKAKADWIVGINATRLFSVLYGQTLNIRRVLSPTLAMICERDSKTCSFAIWKENRFFTAKKKTVTESVVTELFKSGKVALTGCYYEKTGKTHDCVAVLDDIGGQFVNFTMVFGAKKK